MCKIYNKTINKNKKIFWLRENLKKFSLQNKTKLKFFK
jgi:hypothetical protein